MTSTRLSTLLVITGVLVFAGCKSSPTGRSQMMLYSQEQMDQMGRDSFEQMKESQPVNQDARVNRYVRCVADNITAVLPEAYANQAWEVVVFDDASANAFALPGGKIGVHTGLLAIAQNEHQLAAVIGHEVGHVIAEHANERVSRSTFVNIGMQASQAVLRANDVKYEGVLMQALGLGAQFGAILPFSRTHESEADQIGLNLMAQAGFDPKGAVALWQNMAANSEGAPPEFMSTHPSATTRIEDLRKAMPAAKKLQKTSLAQGTVPHCKVPGA